MHFLYCKFATFAAPVIIKKDPSHQNRKSTAPASNISGSGYVLQTNNSTAPPSSTNFQNTAAMPDEFSWAGLREILADQLKDVAKT